MGARLAGATGVGALSRFPSLKHIPLSEHEEVWGRVYLGNSRERPQTERQWDRCRSGGRDHPPRWQHLLNLITLRGLPFACMCNYTQT